MMIIPERFRQAHEAGLRSYLATDTAKVIGKTVALAGLGKDKTEFPIELSLASWKMDQFGYFTAIIRDISQRQQIN